MADYKTAKKATSTLSDDFYFISPALGGLAGVAIGLVIANLVGIV